MRTTDHQPKKDKSHIINIVWTGCPTKDIYNEYKQWINSVNKSLSDKWNVKIMHVFLSDKNQYETWTYEPGKPPTLL